MQQNTAENTEQTTPGTTVQPQTTNNTPTTNLVTTQDPKTVTITTGTTTPSVYTVKRQKELNELVQRFDPKHKTYTVSSTRTSKIKGEKGSVLEVNPKNLENIDGTPVTGNIVVEFVEYTTAKDLIFGGAPTMCNNQLLVSAGSYYINASNNGKAMRIKDGANLNLSVAKIADKQMDIFYGDKDEKGLVQWNWDSDIFVGEAKGHIAHDTVGVIGGFDFGGEGDYKNAPAKPTAPQQLNAEYNCFSIELGDKTYSVITAGNTIKIKKVVHSAVTQYIRNTVFPNTTLCVRGYDEKTFRSYVADTTRQAGYLEYVIKDKKSKDGVDTEYMDVLKNTDIKVPVASIVKKVVPEQVLTDTLAIIKDKADKAQAEINRKWREENRDNADGGFGLKGGWNSNKDDIYHYNANAKNVNSTTASKATATDVMTSLRVTKMGWTNVDRFGGERNPQQLAVQYDKNKFDAVNAILVINGQFSIVNANYVIEDKGEIGFKQMPNNADATLITYTNKGDKVFAQIKKVKTTDGTVQVDLKEMDNKAFKDLIEASIK
jgi:hypothetical protein